MIADNKAPFTEPNLTLSSEKKFTNFTSNHSWEPGWLADHRRESWENLNQITKSSIKDEKWRFSPKHRLGYSQFNQILETANSIKFGTVPDNCDAVFDSIDNILLDKADLISDFAKLKGPSLGANESFQLVNSYFSNGYFIHLPKSESKPLTIRVDHFCPPDGHVTFHKNFIILEDFTELTVIENFISQNNQHNGALTNLTHVILGKGSSLNRVIIQNMAEGSSFHNLENIELHSDSSAINIGCYLGASQSRVETKGSLLDKGANFENYSFVSGKNEQLFDQRTEQHHIAPYCSSNLLSKNVLQDEAKTVFAGMIRVDKDAQQTNALQTNRNLVLTKEAEADSLPGLEILANDVKCTHGATTSRLDQEELFYLLSRGIDRKTAESLISLGFLEEIIEKIPSENISTELREIVSSHFNKI